MFKGRQPVILKVFLSYIRTFFLFFSLSSFRFQFQKFFSDFPPQGYGKSKYCHFFSIMTSLSTYAYAPRASSTRLAVLGMLAVAVELRRHVCGAATPIPSSAGSTEGVGVAASGLPRLSGLERRVCGRLNTDDSACSRNERGEYGADWYAAQADCESRGKTLVTVESEQDSEDVYNFLVTEEIPGLGSTGHLQHWIGLKAAESPPVGTFPADGTYTWQWVTGNQITQNWLPENYRSKKTE